MSAAAVDASTPPAELLERVTEHYDRGQTVEALGLALTFAPLHRWRGIVPCSLASRLATNTGAPRLAARLVVRAWRSDPADVRVQLDYSFQCYERRGPLALWRAQRHWPAAAGGSPGDRASLLALKGRVAADLRDFAAAEALLTQAESMAPEDPWVHLQRAYWLERQDRVEEAYAVAVASQQRHPHPFHRPSVQTAAHLLEVLDRDAEAIELLEAANQYLQSAPVAAQLYVLLAEHEQWVGAEAALERAAALSPLLEPPGQRWLASQRARVAYLRGRRPEAARFAAQVQDPFHQAFAQRLEEPPAPAERIRLEVPFVRQQFKTCAPATFGALARFWSMPAEHVQMAEAICYDGTPAWRQRDWAEQHGWAVREFRVTWESAVALVARGVPFAVSTVDAASAHLQAVIGFDLARGTLLLRDPSQPHALEAHAQPLLENQRPFGPRGQVFLPAAEVARLAGLELPDAGAYDECHRLALALSRHERPAAQAALDRLEAGWPDHALAWDARLDLASYDANPAEEARCLDRLLERFPGAASRQLRRLESLRHAAREERLEFLARACAAPTADPLLFSEYARLLLTDARQLPQAERWLRLALRRRPMDAQVLTALADLRWAEDHRDEATEYYRIVAGLEGFREPLYQSWFVACRQTRQTETALAHLADRFRRFGRRSEQPALTLAWAHRLLDQPDAARQVLAQALELRPDDGHLRLRAAALSVGATEPSQILSLLETARGKVREVDWWRTAAEIAENGGDALEALRCAREILQLEPLALDAHAGVARARALLEGPAAAVAHLREAVAAFPHHCGLRRLLVEWSRELGAAEVESAAHELLAVSPTDAWARRERALALMGLHRLDEAYAEALEAERIEPRQSASLAILGHVCVRRRDLDAARQAFHRALELSVDQGDAIQALIDLASTDRERAEELAVVQRELVRQVVTGDGLLTFLELARPILAPAALLDLLREAHRERPDLWHAWSALVSEFAQQGQLDAALDLAERATGRFPHLPRTWLDLALVQRWRNQPDAEIAAAQRAFELAPAWPRATAALSEAHERAGRLDESRAVLERALRHAPKEPLLHAWLANVLWRLRDHEAAFRTIEQALRLAPAFEYAWNLFCGWCTASGRPELPERFAQDLARERPGDYRGWLMLARVLPGPAARPERLAALEHALELQPRSGEAWDLKAELLTASERFDEALEACNRGVANVDGDTSALRGRRAWVHARRGHLEDAVREMTAVLADNASYAWGWHQLAEWHLERQAFAEAEQAVEHLERLKPHDAAVQRHLGFIRLKRGNPAGARQAFSAALRLDPEDRPAAESLFDLALEAGDLPAAAEVLGGMQTHLPGARTLAHEVLLAVRQDQPDAALRAFAALCELPDPDEWPVEGAATALFEAVLHRPAFKILERAARQPTANPQTGAAAVRLMLRNGNRLRALRLFRRLAAPEFQQRAAAPLAQGLATRGSGWLLRWAIRRHRDVFRQDDTAWGQVGYALTAFKRWPAVAAWLSDWPQRPALQPWMLFNLCLALRQLGRYDAAEQVARHVVTHWGHRDGAGDFHLFLAIEEALRGNTAGAREHLGRVTTREGNTYDQQLLALAQTLVAFQQIPPADRRRWFATRPREAADPLDGRKVLFAMRDVRRTLARTGRFLAAEGGGWRARWWALTRLHWQWSLLPLAPVALAIAVQPPVLVAILIYLALRNRR